MGGAKPDRGDDRITGGTFRSHLYIGTARLLLVLALVAAFSFLIGRALDVEHAQAQAGHDTRAVRVAICRAFGPECAKAIRVAWCESRLNPLAVGNRYGRDPYFGLYQFGAYARRTYGFAWDAGVQARAAARMRRAEGWRPWPVCGRR